ncbi:hypothetical protein MKX03_005056 [Papaver bracteatum]|nr:hypothetical protein MKX03_005056 [Papaver bracteatum]
MPSGAEICYEILLAILPPPLGVGFIHGYCSVELLIRLYNLCHFVIVIVYRGPYPDDYWRPINT